MRSVVSLALVTSLIGSALPVVAEQKTPTSGPIARSVTGEVARFVTAEQRTAGDSEWSRVRRLAPGTELIVTVKSSQSASRYFLGGDESGLTTLNIDAPALPTAARNVLRHLASTHPDYFLAAQKGGQFQLEKNMRLGPDGVFIADRKVAGLAEVVDQRGRQDITEIRTAETESNPAACALAGYFGGGIVGGVPGAIIGGAVGRDSGPALAGMMVGWSVGAVYMYRRCRHKPEKVIYSVSYGSI